MRPSAPSIICVPLLCGCLLSPAVIAAARAEPAASPAAELGIGDVAPPIDVSDWIHPGSARHEQPLSRFEPGTIYVLEFWATWCEHSRGSIPKLADLQKRYARDVVIVAVALDQPQELRDFLVDGDIDVRELATLAGTYCLVADADGSVQESYMDAVMESGLPTAFVIGRQGRIEWVGHPAELEEPLGRIVDGSWDRAAFAARWEELQAPRRAADCALSLAADGHVDEAAATLDRFVTEHATAAATLNDLAWKLVEHSVYGPLPPAVLAAAERAASRSVGLEPDSAAALDTLARVQALQGQLDLAIATQRRAVAHGGDDAADYREFLRHLESRKR